MLSRLPLFLAGLNGFLAVAFGAFGAHVMWNPQAKAWLATGAAYQLAHAVAGVAVERRSRLAAWLFAAGGLIFASALYSLALGGPPTMGAVAPVGGLLLLSGWVTVMVASFRSKP
jgi:uncharacterized membrane protein YgdD (TMEM256/DUF423 family)